MIQDKLGNFNTYDDFNLIRNSKSIGNPQVKKKTLEVEGADGVLDYTDFFGEPKYNNRPIVLNYQLFTSPSNFVNLHSEISNALNGKEVRIVLYDDPDFYYIGRLDVSDLKESKGQAFITITCDCQPYKYKASETVVTYAVSGSMVITLDNLRKRVVPTITTNSQFKFEWDKFSTTVAAGTFQLAEFELVEGANVITVTGTGNVTFKYQEGGM